VLLVDDSPRLKERWGLATERGAVVIRVVPDSPGAQAGLERKDVIIAVDGASVASAKEAVDKVRERQVGDKIVLTIYRGEEKKEIQVTLGSAPERPPTLMKRPGLPWGFLRGLLAQGLLERLRSGRLELEGEDGKVITVELVAGTVQSATAERLTITPKGQTASRTFDVTPDTYLWLGTTRKVENLKGGDRVLVVTEGGSEALAVISAGRKGGRWWKPHPPMPPSHRWKLPEHTEDPQKRQRFGLY
jgi:membrane-associated protease RseP (regulator of RpoE activity)